MRTQGFPPAERAALLERDDYRCQECGSRRNPECHHIVPVSEGGSHALSNGLVLCRSCHIEHHRAESGDHLHTQREAYRKHARALE